MKNILNVLKVFSLDARETIRLNQLHNLKVVSRIDLFVSTYSDYWKFCIILNLVCTYALFKMLEAERTKRKYEVVRDWTLYYLQPKLFTSCKVLSQELGDFQSESSSLRTLRTFSFGVFNLWGQLHAPKSRWRKYLKLIGRKRRWILRGIHSVVFVVTS